MKIYVYVSKTPTLEQKEWANRLRAEYHRVHFQLEKPFNATMVCDAFISDNDEIKSAYKADGIPEFEESMLKNDIDKRTFVQKPNPKLAGNPQVDKLAMAEVDKAVIKNTGGTGALEPRPAKVVDDAEKKKGPTKKVTPEAPKKQSDTS